MGYTIEGGDFSGFRVVDDEIGPLTGRLATEAEALKVAGITAKDVAKPASAASKPAAKRAPRKPAAKKAAAPKQPTEHVDAVTTESVTPDES